MSRVYAPADRRFRRAHMRPTRRRSRWRSIARTVAIWGSATVALAAGAYYATEAVMQASVLRIDRIEVDGNVRMPPAEVMERLAGMRDENILLADLDAWREQLLVSSWVRDATMRRRLPSTIEVVVVERRPMAIGRMGQELYLVDEQGTVIDVYGPQYADLDLPIVDGLITDGQAPAGSVLTADGERAALAARVIASLAPMPELARRLSQIDVSDRHNVEVLLAGDPAVIAIGKERFLTRLQQYVELAGTLRERVEGIDHVDLRFDGRIYVRPARTGQTQRPVSLPVARGQAGSIERTSSIER